MGILAKLIPIRDWLYLAAFVAMIIGGAWVYHDIKKKGYAECQAKVQRAIQEQQTIADQNAEVYESQQQKTRIEYRTRVKEVVKHVPVNHACDLPGSTVRMLNNAITGTGSPAGKSGVSVLSPADAH